MRSNGSLILEKYSFGMGDRFAHQAQAQLRACMQIVAKGVDVTPVWNKSYREHAIVGSSPASVRVAAEAAIRELNWSDPFYIDADHIRPDTVDSFVASSDYYTLDVADAIGQPAEREVLEAFADRDPKLAGTTQIPCIDEPIVTARAEIERIAGKYLKAVQEA